MEGVAGRWEVTQAAGMSHLSVPQSCLKDFSTFNGISYLTQGLKLHLRMDLQNIRHPETKRLPEQFFHECVYVFIYKCKSRFP